MLKPGNYMLVSKVKEFITNYFELYVDAINTLPIHQGELGEYYNTDTIRNVIHDDIFREMECECVTYMILNK